MSLPVGDRTHSRGSSCTDRHMREINRIGTSPWRRVTPQFAGRSRSILLQRALERDALAVLIVDWTMSSDVLFQLSALARLAGGVC